MQVRMLTALVVFALAQARAQATSAPIEAPPLLPADAPPLVQASDDPVSGNPLDASRVDSADLTLIKMQDTQRDVLTKVADAHSNHDVVKLNCLTEKLTQIQALVR